MINSKTLSKLAAATMIVPMTNLSQAASFNITITNNAPTNGVAITPVWGGFHNGSFDSYNGGQSSQLGLERLAEDGNTSVISSDFLGGYTYINGGVSDRVLTSQTSGRSDFTLASAGPPPFLPGQSASVTIDNLTLANNRYFSYASMILPSNDYYIANGNPTAHDLESLFLAGGSITFNIGLAGSINDAGTEVNDFNTTAGNPLFGLAGGQTGPNQGADQNGVNANVSDAFAGFLNSPVIPAEFDFNNPSLYQNGIATITITAVPEPSSSALFGLAACSLLLRRKR